MKLKPKVSEIWENKLLKTAQDVKEFSMKKPDSNSTHHVNMFVHGQSKSRLKFGDASEASIKSEKDENFQKMSDPKANQNFTNKTCDNCEACTCKSKQYVVTLDSILVIIFAIQRILQSEHLCTNMDKVEEKGSEVSYRDGSISKIPSKEEFFDIEIDGIEDDENPEEKDASETSLNGQPHQCQGDIHTIEESFEVDDPEPLDNENAVDDAADDEETIADYSGKTESEDPEKKEIIRKPLGKLAKKYKSEHISKFESHVKDVLAKTAWTNLGYCDSEVRVIPSGILISFRAAHMDGLLNPDNIHWLSAVIRRKFGLPEGSVHLTIEKCSCCQAKPKPYSLDNPSPSSTKLS